MSKFTFWGWDKKPRTMLRFVKSGDIFCFHLRGREYCFGRVISKIMTGHVVEFFNFVNNLPEISEGQVNTTNRLLSPVVIDTYGLFDKKVYKDSDWRIIGHQHDFIPENIDDVYFTYGVGNSCKKVNVFDHEVTISEKEAENYPRLSPHGDHDVKILLTDAFH